MPKFFYIAVFSLMIAEERNFICAFRWKKQQSSDKHKSIGEKSRPFFRPWRQAAAGSGLQKNTSHERRQSIIESLTNVVQDGASIWSNHISHKVGPENESSKEPKRKTSMKPTASVSQLYKRIQVSRNHDTMNIARLDDDASGNKTGSHLQESIHRSRKSNWPEHFFEEILAYIAGGAAATSAFSAIIHGTIFATALVTIGALASVLFYADEGDRDYMSKDNFDGEGYQFHSRTNAESKDCELDETFFERLRYVEQNEKQLPTNAFDESTMHELKKCFAGKPSSDIMLFTDPSNINTCSRRLPQYEYSGFGVDSTGQDYNEYIYKEHPDNIDIEDANQSKVIELTWHDSRSTAKNSYYATKKNRQRRKKQISYREKFKSDQKFILEKTEREGAVLLSDTFRVTSSVFGLLADSVRFAGESTAATTGGTMRLIGGAIKASGWAVSSLGSTISSEKPTEEGRISTTNYSGQKIHRTRRIAGESVKLVGDAIENVAESLLLVGTATETVAFAATGALEASVRVVESFASSLSNVFASEGQRRTLSSNMPAQVALDINMSEKAILKAVSEKTTREKIPGDDLVQESLLIPVEDEIAEDPTDRFLKFSSWIMQNASYVMQDIAGVSTNAPQLLIILIFLYLASLMLIEAHYTCLRENWKTSEQVDKETCLKEQDKPTKIPEGITAGDDDTHSILTLDSTMKREPDVHMPSQGAGVINHFMWMAVLPLRLCYMVYICIYSFIFNKKTVLLILYILGWLFICQMNQNRSAIIEKKSMLKGYKNAVESIGSSEGSNYLESAFWLNTVISRVWSVHSPESLNKGGIEPLLESSISNVFARCLEESYARPSGIAHVSLASFKLGGSPPIIKNIVIKGTNPKEAKVYLGFDVIMVLGDAVLILDIKPSSLEYKMMPSTKVAINSLDLQMSLDVSIQGTPEYPYLSFVNISLSEIPDFSLRIVPQQESGLNGIDFGSFPLISKWVKEVINNSIIDYITPHYIAINVPAWFIGSASENENIVDYY